MNLRIVTLCLVILSRLTFTSLATGQKTNHLAIHFELARIKLNENLGYSIMSIYPGLSTSQQLGLSWVRNSKRVRFEMGVALNREKQKSEWLDPSILGGRSSYVQLRQSKRFFGAKLPLRLSIKPFRPNGRFAVGVGYSAMYVFSSKYSVEGKNPGERSEKVRAIRGDGWINFHRDYFISYDFPVKNNRLLVAELFYRRESFTTSNELTTRSIGIGLKYLFGQNNKRSVNEAAGTVENIYRLYHFGPYQSIKPNHRDFTY